MNTLCVYVVAYKMQRKTAVRLRAQTFKVYCSEYIFQAEYDMNKFKCNLCQIKMKYFLFSHFVFLPSLFEFIILSS